MREVTMRRITANRSHHPSSRRFAGALLAPLSFVPNAGQIDRQVRYYAQGSGYAFYFTPHKTVLSLTKGKRGVALDLTPLGANPNARLEASARGSGRVNYFIGSKHETNLLT